MKVTICSVDGTAVVVDRMPDESTAELVEEVVHKGEVDWMTVTLNDTSVTHIRVKNIIRIDVDPEDEEDEE